MSSRPVVQVHGGDAKTTPLPAVFLVPIRPDVVKDVQVSMSKNSRQAYAVSAMAGMQHSAESWGTGRAVARIPRVSGGGTHAAGQGAFGNMCRHGRMFAPTKVWRRWHRNINVAQKRFAVASAIAASGVTSLVLARGHRIEEIPEVPLVVAQKSLEGVSKTKQAIALLKQLKAYDDVEKVESSRTIRAGKGKMRNRRYVQRVGPLVLYRNPGSFLHAFRNVPGVTCARVDSVSLLQLAPGGHLGRFCVWAEDAFTALDDIFGDGSKASKTKGGFVLPKADMTNADVSRIINSSEIQSVLRPKRSTHRPALRKNPLKNLGVRIRLNPYYAAQRRQAIKHTAHLKEKKVADAIKVRKAAHQKKLDARKKKNQAVYDVLLSNIHKYEPKTLNKK